MKKYVTELQGAELDYLVAHAEGLASIIEGDVCYIDGKEVFSPSSNSSQAWPILERENITINPQWNASVRVNRKIVDPHGKEIVSSFNIYKCGQTPLQAAMRCYVASKFGEKVNVRAN